MTQPTARPRPPHSQAAAALPPPEPSTPIDDALVDGAAVTLLWHPVPGASAYGVQAADDAAFQHLRLDTSVGESLSVTVYETFPTNGARFFWRVRGLADGAEGPYSEPASFRAVTDEEVEVQRAEDAAQVAQSIRRQTTAQAKSSAEVAEDAAPHLTSMTTAAEAAAFIFMLLATTALLIILLLLLPIRP